MRTYEIKNNNNHCRGEPEYCTPSETSGEDHNDYDEECGILWLILH